MDVILCLISSGRHIGGVVRRRAGVIIGLPVVDSLFSGGYGLADTSFLAWNRLIDEIPFGF